jgi:hypothetical protein
MVLLCTLQGRHKRSLQFLCDYFLICIIIIVPIAVNHCRKISCPWLQMVTAAVFIDLSIRGFYYTADLFWQDEVLCLDCSLLYLWAIILEQDFVKIDWVVSFLRFGSPLGVSNTDAEQQNCGSRNQSFSIAITKTWAWARLEPVPSTYLHTIHLKWIFNANA